MPPRRRWRFRAQGPGVRDEPCQEDSCHCFVVEAPHELGLLLRSGYAGVVEEPERFSYVGDRAKQTNSWSESSEETDSGSSSDRGAITPDGVSSSGSAVGDGVAAGGDSVAGGFVGVMGAAAVGDGAGDVGCACVSVVVAMGLGSSGACVGLEHLIRAAKMNSATARVSFCTMGGANGDCWPCW